jgi:hypothetical protein
VLAVRFAREEAGLRAHGFQRGAVAASCGWRMVGKEGSRVGRIGRSDAALTLNAGHCR